MTAGDWEVVRDKLPAGCIADSSWALRVNVTERPYERGYAGYLAPRAARDPAAALGGNQLT